MFLSKTGDITPISDFFDPKFLHLNYIDLLKECYQVEPNIDRKQVASIERETVEQGKVVPFIDTMLVGLVPQSLVPPLTQIHRSHPNL